MRKVFLVISTSLLIVISIVFFSTVSSFVQLLSKQEEDNTALNSFLDVNGTDSSIEPKLKTTTIVSGLYNPWDIAFLNKDIFFYPEKIGAMHMHNIATGEDVVIAKPNISLMGEGGLLGMAVDNDFSNNHYLYTCMNINTDDKLSIVVARWTVSQDLKSTEGRKDIITDIPANTQGGERHSGCRVRVATTGEIWVGTGDTANGTVPQDPKSLGGKVLRVDKDGKGVTGNLGDPFDPRIFNYGHRNIQGLYLFPAPINGVYGITAEHGPDKDDEVNLIKQGNYGWDPIPGYNELKVPMTDLVKFPDAIPAIWSSGTPAMATSGITMIKGNQWKAWNGAVIIALLKDMQLRLQTYNNWKIERDEKVLDGYGRIRIVVQGPDGDLFFGTDNGGALDVIVRVTPE
ncbi:MAG: PQQ-dependent sugar dehydrogenase [Candidatus Dojkabacteria bacterium]